MTFEDKAVIVISQLRADRDRLQNAINKMRAEIGQEIANPSDGNDYECGRVDAFNEVLNLIDEHIKEVSDAQEL